MKICFNGDFYDAGEPVIGVQNRSFKWGDGLFETMKVYQGQLLLSDLHFERLFISLQLLQLEKAPNFSKEKIVNEVKELCILNNCISNGRIRLAVFRDDKNKIGYSIEAVPLEADINSWKEEGQQICIYPYARKTMDAFANLKSANFLPYVMAQKYAAEKRYDDALVLNSDSFLCDSSRANIFLIRNEEIFTPALYQGCINGVMRRVLIDTVKKMGYRLHQKEVSEEDLLNADEVFLTNAIQIMRWVKSYKGSQYSFSEAKKIFDEVSATLFNQSITTH